MTKTEKKPKSLAKRIFGWITTVLAILIVAFCALMLYTKSTGNLLFLGNRACIYVLSESMEPLIPARSFIWVEKVDASDVEVEDIIMFRSDDPAIQGSYNTHKVVAVVGDHAEFVTRGIHNYVDDEYTAKAANVAGRYVGNAKVLNAFANWFSTKVGLLVTLIVIIAICCAVYVPDIIRQKKKDDDQTT